MSKRTSCPCKRLPMCLSSFTAAEYGDLHSLQRSHYNRTTAVGSRIPLVDRLDSGGYTPLYLAAQHNHVSATSLLLQLGAKPDGNCACGATPLHRASYSGAISTMRLLLDEKWHCDLLAKDTSFGDCMTPLHKAAAGGRYLAVKLLLHALRERKHNVETSMMKQGLAAIDSMQRTPLDVAVELSRNQMEEQKSVRRWDAVAGGVADWQRCVELLKAAECDMRKCDSSDDNYCTLPAVPKHLSGIASCLDCENSNGTCLTASWEAAFRSALSSSISGTALTESTTELPSQDPSYDTDIGSTLSSTDEPVAAGPTEGTNSNDASSSAVGRKCEMCGLSSFALYPSANGALVCRACFKPKRRLQRS